MGVGQLLSTAAGFGPAENPTEHDTPGGEGTRCNRCGTYFDDCEGPCRPVSNLALGIVAALLAASIAISVIGILAVAFVQVAS